MKIRLTKPWPQPSLGKVIPAGVTIDAPAGLSERILRLGRGKPVQGGETPQRANPAPKNDTPARKKVKRNA